MYKFIIFTVVMLLALNLVASELKLIDSDSGTYVELRQGVHNGDTASEILKQISCKKNITAFRILGQFSSETQNTLMSYYTEKMPTELQKALNSSGNIHNPALYPLRQNFINAFKASSLFKEIDTELKLNRYKVNKISFEKFETDKTKIYVSEIWLNLSKTPNNALNKDATKVAPIT